MEAMILISESAYKELLHSHKKYLELKKNDKHDNNTHNETDKESETCECKDQLGDGEIRDSGETNCECKKTDANYKPDENPNPELWKSHINNFKSSADFFKELSQFSWFKRNPRKVRKIAEILFFSPSIVIGIDDSLHFEGVKIDTSNIYDIIKNEVLHLKKFVPGQIVVQRILENHDLKPQSRRKRIPKDSLEKQSDPEPEKLSKDWYLI